MPDPTDPRAVADDPSGIVQQMPEGGDEALAELDRMMADGLLHTVRQLALCLYGEAQTYPCDDVKRMASDLTCHHAADAVLRAKNARLRALIREGCNLLAEESEALRNSVTLLGDGGFSDHHADAPTIERINELEDWIGRAARAALSPETDGGQDDR